MASLSLKVLPILSIVLFSVVCIQADLDGYEEIEGQIAKRSLTEKQLLALEDSYGLHPKGRHASGNHQQQQQQGKRFNRRRNQRPRYESSSSSESESFESSEFSGSSSESFERGSRHGRVSPGPGESHAGGNQQHGKAFSRRRGYRNKPVSSSSESNERPRYHGRGLSTGK